MEQKIGTFSLNLTQKLPKIANIKKTLKNLLALYKQKVLRNWKAYPNPKFLRMLGCVERDFFVPKILGIIPFLRKSALFSIITSILNYKRL